MKIFCSNSFKAIVLYLFVSLFFTNLKAGTVTSTAGGGAWELPTTWANSIVPVLGDDVIIQASATVTVNDARSCNSVVLTLPTAGTTNLIIGALGNLTVTLDATINGGAGAALKTTLTNGGILNIGGNVRVVLGSGGGSTAAVATATFANNGTANISGNLILDITNSGVALAKIGAGSTLNLVGDFTTVSTTGYSFMTFEGNGIVNLTGALSTFYINSYTVVDFGSSTGTLNLNSDNSTLSLGGTGTCKLLLGSGASNVNLKGNFVLPGVNTFTAGGASTFTYKGSVPQSIVAVNYFNLVWSSTGDRILPAIGTVGVAGAFTKGTNNYDNTGSTISFNGTGTQTVPAFRYNNLTIAGARTLTNSVTISNIDTVDIAGAFVYSSTFVTGTLISTGSTIKYSGSQAQTVIAFPYNDLMISKEVGTIASTANNYAILVAGNCTVKSGILAVGTGGAVAGQQGEYTFSGNFLTSILEIKNGAVLRLIGTAAFPAGFPSAWKNVILNTTSDCDYASVNTQIIVARQYSNLLCSSTGGARTLDSSSNIKISGAFTPNTPTIAYTNTGNTIEYNGITAQTIAAFNYNNLLLTNTPALTSLTGTAGIAGVFTPKPTTTNLATNTGTIDYNGTGAQNVIAFDYFNLSISGARTINNVTLAPIGVMRVAGTLANSSAFLTGKIVNTGSTVEYNGTAAQSVIDFPYNNLTINKTSGAGSLAANVTVPSVLNLKAGLLILNGKTLIIANSTNTAITRTSGAIVSDSTDNSSKIQWNIGIATGSYIYPFGKTLLDYIPFTANVTSGSVGNLTVSTYGTKPDNTPLPVIPTPVTGIAQQSMTDAANKVIDRFWQIDASAPVTPKVTLTFTYSASEKPVGFNPAGVGARRWSGTAWDAAISGQTFTANSATVPAVTSFSPWTIYQSLTPLAVNLQSFEAVPVDNKFIKLAWVTENEININNYVIERAVTGSNNFTTIGNVEAVRNSTANSYVFNDNTVKQNVTYQYRLRMVETNRNAYSAIKLAGITGKNLAVNVLPNPSAGAFKIMVEGYKGVAEIMVYNTQNQVMISKSASIEYGTAVSVDLTTYAKGMYLLKMKLSTGMVVKQLIVQ